MNNDKNIRKINSQKVAALFLIIYPMVIIQSEFKKNDYNLPETINSYILVFSSIILMICGSLALRQTLRKIKELSK